MNPTPDPRAECAEWLKRQRQIQAPEGFADAVMQRLSAVDREIEPSAGQWSRAAFFAKAALFIAAGVFGIGRYGVIIFCLLHR